MRRVWQIVALGIALFFAFVPELKALTEVSGSPFSAVGNLPVALTATTSTTNPFLYSANNESNGVSIFQIGVTTGKLGTASQTTGTGLVNGAPIDLAYVRSDVLLVLNQAGNAVSSFTITPSTGALTFRDTECTGGAMVCPADSSAQDADPAGIAVKPTGDVFYVTNQASGTISAFTLSGSGIMTFVTTTTAQTARKPTGIAANNSFVFVANRGNNTVSVYSIGSTPTTLTEVSGSPVATGSNPEGVAITSAGDRLFVTNNTGNSVSAFTVSTTTGALAKVTNSPFSVGTGVSGPKGLALIGTGSLIVADQASNHISIFSIDGAGALSAVSGSPFPISGGPTDALVEVNGKFFYVANAQVNNIRAFSTADLPGAPGTTGGIPTLSEWGMIILILLRLTLAAWRLGWGPAPVGMPVRWNGRR